MLTFPAWVPDHETLEYVLPHLPNPTMVPADFDRENDTPDDRWRLGRYEDDQWIINPHVRLSWIGRAGVIYPQLPKPYEQDEEGNDIKYGSTVVPGLHIDLHAIGKPLIRFLLHDPATGEPMPQEDQEGNLLPIYGRTCIRALLGTMADVPVIDGVAEGIEGSSGMRMLNDVKIRSKRLQYP